MSQELQQRYDALEIEKQSLNPNNADDRFRQTIVEQEQAKIKDQMDAEDRLQRQAAEVAEIQLPEDYDERWGVVGANQEISNLLRQVKEFLFSQHNDELAKLQQEHKERIVAFDVDKAQLIELVAGFETKLADVEGRLFRADADKGTALEQLAEAESKRDNAVAAKEEAEADRDKARSENKSLKGQIDELEGMLRTYRSRSNSGAVSGLVLTSTLKTESEEERKARLERERVEHLNHLLVRRGSDPLPLPTSPAQAEAAAATEEPDDRFPADEDAHDSERLVEADEGVAVAGEAAPELTLEGLAERVKALEEFKTAFEIGFFDK